MGWYCVCGYLNRQHIKKKTVATKSGLTRIVVVCEKCGEPKKDYVPAKTIQQDKPFDEGFAVLKKKTGVTVMQESELKWS